MSTMQGVLSAVNASPDASTALNGDEEPVNYGSEIATLRLKEKALSEKKQAAEVPPALYYAYTVTQHPSAA